MDMELKAKVVLVTGGADGIGLKSAELLAEEGAYVALADINFEKARVASETLNKLGMKTIAVGVDVHDQESVTNMVNEVVKTFGRIDILVNNAGIGYFKTMDEETMDDWYNVLNINLTGVHLCTREVFKYMKEQKSGKIISMASLGGQIGGMKVTPGYVASKAGVVGLTKSYARNGAKYGITANAVAPGPTETNMAKGRYSADTTMLGRLAEPLDVAKAVFFLASCLSDYLTGITVDVNGGALMR
ncbi:MAG: SDR family oxidoreductase [Sphaerochaeta sp.]|nr:SDR family oxidoreductase [Sphaerochaeta sp.]